MKNIRSLLTLRLALGFVALAALSSCTASRSGFEDGDTRKMVELLMPQRIEIVEAFTAFQSFDDDDIPDGIELLLQAHDAYGDSVKIAGGLRIELYSHQPASADPKGRRLLDPWVVTLDDEKDQRRYWNMVTGMYEIPLEFPAGSVTAAEGSGGQFVLAVTYNTPLDTHLTDEVVLPAPPNLR